MLHFVYIVFCLFFGFLSSWTRYICNAEILTVVTRKELPGSLEAQSLSCVRKSGNSFVLVIRLFPTPIPPFPPPSPVFLLLLYFLFLRFPSPSLFPPPPHGFPLSSPPPLVLCTWPFIYCLTRISRTVFLTFIRTFLLTFMPTFLHTFIRTFLHNHMVHSGVQQQLWFVFTFSPYHN